MILYLYALADGLPTLSGLPGLSGEDLTLVSLGEFVAVGGWMPHPPSPTRETLSAQDRIVRELHARAEALLPMRFGASAPDLDAARRAIEALGAGVRERLAVVRGRDQMTLRLVRSIGAEGTEGAEGAEGAGAKGASSGKGTRYLKARALRATPPEIAPLLDELRELQRATRVEVGTHPRVAATIYQLIDRGASDRYRQTVERAAERLPHLTIRISGPAPGYAFAAR